MTIFFSGISNFLLGPDFLSSAADSDVKIFGGWLTEIDQQSAGGAAGSGVYSQVSRITMSTFLKHSTDALKRKALSSRAAQFLAKNVPSWWTYIIILNILILVVSPCILNVT